MKFQKITKKQYEEKINELKKLATDFFGEHKLSTLSNSTDEYHIITFDNLEERNSFIKTWKETVEVSQRDRGYKGKIKKLKI